MAFTISSSVGYDNGEAYIRITNITGGSASNTNYSSFYYYLQHQGNSSNVDGGSIGKVDFFRDGLRFSGLYNGTYIFGAYDTNDGTNPPVQITVTNSTVINYGPISVDALTAVEATRYDEGSITVRAHGGTHHLKAYISNTNGFQRTVTLQADADVVVNNLPRLTTDTTYTVTVVDRDASFASASRTIVLHAFTGCRITLAVAYETLSPGGATITAPFSDLSASAGTVYAQVRLAGTTAWGPAAPVTLAPGSGGAYMTTTVSLYNGRYDLRAYYMNAGGGQCAAEWPNIDISRGVAPPNPCLLTAVGVGYAPSRAGVNDGTVRVTVDNTQGIDVTLRLSQSGQVLYQQTTARTATGTTPLPPRTDPYTFEMTGILPGIYDLQGSISASCQSTSVAVTVDPPELQIGDQLTFLPWVQPLLAHAADSSSGTRPTVSLGATLRTDHGTGGVADDALTLAAAEIYGPGDVLGIAQRSLLTTAPAPGAVGFSPLQLAFIDFKDEDLPWRYSTIKIPARPATPFVPATATTPAVPARPATLAAPLPWLMLLVLQASEFQRQNLTGQPLPSINVRATATGVYPGYDNAQQQLWAHVQVNTTIRPVVGAQVPATPEQPTDAEIKQFLSQDLPGNPDLAYSRVVCPRRLAPDTTYYAFLVPTVEAGRLAGLGQEFGAADVRASAIPNPSTPAADRAFPVYYQWSFSTGSEDDFETLVQQLHQANGSTSAAAAPNLAVPVGTSTYQLPMVGALVDPDAPAPTTSSQTTLKVAQYLYDQVNPRRTASGRPLVSAPLYGRAYFATPALVAPVTTVETSWKHTVNLDPRYRALAAIGAEVVRDNQEEYVRRAWEQVKDILLANEQLRQAQYGLRTTAGLRDQHLPVNTTITAPSTSRRAAVSAKTTATATGSTSNLAAPQTALADYGLHLTVLALRRIRVSQATRDQASIDNADNPDALGLPRVTVYEAIRRSDVPLAAFSPAFRRISKPFGNYQVGQAGRPLRPTQAEAEADTTDLRTAGTSLRQRDAVLTQLSDGTLAAAPVHAETLRGYQFIDDRVDDYLKSSVRPAGNQPPPITLAPRTLTGAARQAFSNAAHAFATQDVNATTQVITAVGFRKPQYIRPSLPLAPLKNDVVEGTKPGPVFIEKIKTVAPSLGTLLSPHGDFLSADFSPEDFLTDLVVADAYQSPPIVQQPAPAAQPQARFAAQGSATSITATVTITTASTPATDAAIPVIKQAKAFPVFKEAMAEALRLRHPELFVPGLAEFPTGGIAVLDVNQAFIEAYMVGLNHALGSELSWRGFPVDLRATFFQQFWDVSEHFNATLAPGAQPTAAQEAALLDVQPLDEWGSRTLGANAVNAPQPGTQTLRLAVRSELLRRYPTLVLALQDDSLTAAQAPEGYDDPANYRHPLQRLAVGQDVVVVAFDVSLQHALDHCALVLMERPGQPKFGLDAEVAGQDYTQDPVGWNDLTWAYAQTPVNTPFMPATTGVFGSKPHAAAEPVSVAYLVDSSRVAYALFQEPILATLLLQDVLSA